MDQSELKAKTQQIVQRETRLISQNFSIGEYGQSWTKVERLLFLEILNSIKDFYTNKDCSQVVEYTDESITLAIPVNMIDPTVIKVKNRSIQLLEASRGLMEKTIQKITSTTGGQFKFRFVNIFIYIEYDPRKDKNVIEMKIPKEIFKEMLPISAYASLDYLIVKKIDTGNALRLYEVFKTYAFRKNFIVSFDFLRQQLGFMQEGKYPTWKEFNRSVLKPAVNSINKYKEFDIEVLYTKARGKNEVEFTVIQHHNPNRRKNILDLNDRVSSASRKLNMLQSKYVDTLIKNCAKSVQISNPKELKEWIISDILAQQSKCDSDESPFDFSKICQYVSKQVRKEVYTRPHSHPYWMRIYHDSEGNIIDDIVSQAEAEAEKKE